MWFFWSPVWENTSSLRSWATLFTAASSCRSSTSPARAGTLSASCRASSRPSPPPSPPAQGKRGSSTSSGFTPSAFAHIHARTPRQDDALAVLSHQLGNAALDDQVRGGEQRRGQAHQPLHPPHRGHGEHGRRGHFPVRRRRLHRAAQQRRAERRADLHHPVSSATVRSSAGGALPVVVMLSTPFPG